MGATIKQIAQRAGVAISTVSSVLNNPEGGAKAGAKTRDRIMQVAAELNYTPSIMAKGLRQGKSYLVAMMRQGFSGSFLVKAVNGAEEVFHNHDYNMLLSSFSDPEDCRERIKKLIQKRVDGIMLATYITPELLGIMEEYSQQLPIINVFYQSPLKSINSVFVDGAAIGKLAAEYLLQLGHRRILLLGNRPGCVEAFYQVMGSSSDCFHYHIDITYDGGRLAVERMLKDKLPVTAVFAYNDDNAAGVIYEAGRRGLKVPDDLSVIGVNDTEIAKMLSPQLTTIAQPQHEQGRKAAELLLDAINGKNSGDVILRPELIIRESCKGVRKC